MAIVEEIDSWLSSNKEASIDNIILTPEKEPNWPSTTKYLERGQAKIFFLLDRKGKKWLLKKFFPNMQPETKYINAIGPLIPNKIRAFDSGTKRKVLTAYSLKDSKDFYYSRNLATDLENTILMPYIDAYDWVLIFNRIINGMHTLTRQQRILLSYNLCNHIQTLEDNNIAHRDLSNGNILVDTKTWMVHIIDWDCMYHPDLQMPDNTTIGTNGYIGPMVLEDGKPKTEKTWHSKADRFSMSVLIMEFLACRKGLIHEEDDALLNQDELYSLYELSVAKPGIELLVKTIKDDYPDAVELFKRTIRARNYEECPSPKDWIKAIGRKPCGDIGIIPIEGDPRKELAELYEKIYAKKTKTYQIPSAREDLADLFNKIKKNS